MDIRVIEGVEGAKLKVIGVGGSGGNAVNNMIESGLEKVEFIVANTDAQDLVKSKAQVKVQIGANITKGLGTGMDPSKGRAAANEDKDKIRDVLAGANMVFIAAGLGGGTGTGASPVIAQIAKEMGALTVAVISKPFRSEGRQKKNLADEGHVELRHVADTVISIPNDRLLALAHKKATLREMFMRADEVLYFAVKGISDIINTTGHMNLDFADVETVMSEQGDAIMGFGSARGDNRAIEAAELAISSPLLSDISIRGARAALVNITCGEDLGMMEMNDILALIQSEADENARILTGVVEEASLGDEIRVTVIATGLNQPAAAAKPLEVVRGGIAVSKEMLAAAVGDSMTPERPTMVSAVDLTVDEEELTIPTFLRRQAD